MQRLIGAAALAATLTLVPGATHGLASEGATPAIAAMATPAPTRAVAVTAPAAEPAPAPQFGLAAHEHSHGSGLAPGQTPDDFREWLASSAGNRAALAAFERRLAADGVDRVVPVWQLVRTSGGWRGCDAEPFEIAPRDKWDNIVETLKFIRDEVVPAIGRVEALSAFRNEELNRCSAGAPLSAHRHFFALDLVPVDASVTRSQIIRKVCAAHARSGRAHNIGLGFYSRTRFHVDSKSFRKWGPNGKGATSPCITQV